MKGIRIFIPGLQEEKECYNSEGRKYTQMKGTKSDEKKDKINSDIEWKDVVELGYERGER